ncbi:MAG: DegT/DnrJ/EryC1/StrS family aminotransferase [Methanomicrobiales archaeon]|nr:DegT/DnrJ/EryC1/StrS family aminotransferase [Methanomicrobiales archaeon]
MGGKEIPDRTMAGYRKVPVCEPVIGEQELRYVIDCLKTNWISSRGRYVTDFESRFAAYCGAKEGIATTNGTTALHLALATLKVGPGDEVILPAFTMMATAFAVLYCGARPVLVDADPETWNMDPSLLAEKITGKTRVILPVHIYGHPCDMDPIRELAGDHRAVVVEDAAEAHGAEYRGRRAGSIGQIGCFSFYANKIITTGEGGMVVTSDPALASRARALKDLAFDPMKRFLHTDVGFNYRMTNIQAAIGLAQLERIDTFVAARRATAARYTALLGDLPGLRLPVEKPWARNVYWMYGIVAGKDAPVSRDRLAPLLAARGVETRTFFVPVHQQPVCRDLGLFRGERYPVAEELGKNGLYLPSGSGLTGEEIKYTSRCLHGIWEQGR